MRYVFSHTNSSRRSPSKSRKTASIMNKNSWTPPQHGKETAAVRNTNHDMKQQRKDSTHCLEHALLQEGEKLSGLSVQINRTIIDTRSTNAIGGLSIIPLFHQALFRGGFLTWASSMVRDIMYSKHQQDTRANQPAEDPLTRGNARRHPRRGSERHTMKIRPGKSQNWTTPRQRRYASCGRAAAPTATCHSCHQYN